MISFKGFETVGNVLNLLRINISGRSDLLRDVLPFRAAVSWHFIEKNLTEVKETFAINRYDNYINSLRSFL